MTTARSPKRPPLRLALDAWYEGDAWVDGPDRPPVASLTARPGPTGAFTASLPLTALADGYYSIELLVGDRILRTSTIEVGPIAKPAYQLEVTTGRRVYIADDRIKVTVKASFFEGTPVAGVPLRTDGYLERNLTTDATGTATYRTTAKTEYDEGPDWATINVNPARAEEGEINGASRSFLIFPSSRTVEATARIANDRVAVNGSVHLVDVDRLEAEVAAVGWDWDLDPRGAAVRGATVTVRFVELIPVRTKTGTEYDFIEKKVVPVYEDRIVERSAGSVKVKSAANGSYKASIRATRNDHDYRVSVSVGDPDGNVARTSTYANRHRLVRLRRPHGSDPRPDGSRPGWIR